MNKTDLVRATADKSGLSQKDAGAALDAVTAAIVDALASGDSVQLPGFGTFSVRERAARTGRNPATGESIQIAASKNAGFKAGKNVRERLNG